MNEPMILDEEQEAAVQRMLSEPSRAVLNASEMGRGKTVMTVELTKRLGASTILVICPLATRVGWERTFNQQQIGLSVQRIDSTVKGKAAYAALAQKEPGVYLVGREYFRMLEWKKIKPDVAVYDEIHSVQNRNGVGFKVLKTLKAGFKVGLSGTPGGNKFQGLWSVCRWLWPDQVERSFWRWVTQYARTQTEYFASGEVVKVVGEREKGAFVKTLPCYVRLESSLSTEYIEEIRYVELTPTQRKIYTEMEDEMIMWLGENPSVASVPIVQRIRLRQITLGVPSSQWITVRKRDKKTGLMYEEDKQDIFFDEGCKSSKIDALKEIINELDEGTPILVLCDSQKFVREVTRRLGDKAVEWSGKVTHHKREELASGFVSGKYQYIVAVIPAVAEGLDGLQHVANHVVWLSRSENDLMNRQAAARLHRTGQQKHVYSYDIQAADTYDSGIFQRLELQQKEMRATLSVTKEAA